MNLFFILVFVCFNTAADGIVFFVLHAFFFSFCEMFVLLSPLLFQEQPLGGWVVRRTHPDSGDISFHIPPNYTLPGGSTLTVSGPEALATNS